jgi:hypothetical protein
MVSIILHQVAEHLVVFIHTVGPLLQMQELLLLAVHETHRNVVPAERCMELRPWDLVAVLKCGGVSGPSCHC